MSCSRRKRTAASRSSCSRDACRRRRRDRKRRHEPASLPGGGRRCRRGDRRCAACATIRSPKTSWVAADIEHADLTSIFRGDYASSVGAYSSGPKNRAVDESWPTEGTPSSFYARHKAEVERVLDRFEAEHPSMRVVRIRPALIFKRASAEEQRRYFLGPLFPRALARRGAIAFVPDLAGLRFQAVHADDVADAYRRAIVENVRGAFNVAADPVLDAAELARALEARAVPLPVALVRVAMDLTWRLRLQPTPPGWLDMGLSVPLMDTTRVRTELGWQARHSSVAAVLELLAGIREGAGAPTPVLRTAGSR